jgi:hypothetical protein
MQIVLADSVGGDSVSRHLVIANAGRSAGSARLRRIHQDRGQANSSAGAVTVNQGVPDGTLAVRLLNCFWRFPGETGGSSWLVRRR